MIIRFAVFSTAVLAMCYATSAATVDFEDLSLSPNTFWKGPDLSGTNQPTPWGTTLYSGSFTSGGATFNNAIDLPGGFWSGWAYSNTTDVTTPGIVGGVAVNDSSAYDPHHLADGGGDGSANYGVAFGGFAGDSVITLPVGAQPVSMKVINTTYAALIMLSGDASGFSKKFGDNLDTVGTIETDFPDWFLLKVIGLDAGNQQIGSVDFYLADYRFANDGDDYVVDEWTEINLSPLAAAAKLTFALSSSDSGTFGMNTPSYFAMDNLVLQPVPEPASALLAAGVGFGALIVILRRTAPAVRSIAA